MVDLPTLGKPTIPQDNAMVRALAFVRSTPAPLPQQENPAGASDTIPCAK